MIEKRLLEQRSAFEGLLASTFPLALKPSSSSEETRLGLAGSFQEVPLLVLSLSVVSIVIRGAYSGRGAYE
jgi:hypothetical protein